MGGPDSGVSPDSPAGQVMTGRGRPTALWGAVVVILLLVGGALGWAGRELLLPPDPLPEGREFSVVKTHEGMVERSLSLNVAAQWSGGPEVINAAEGVLTERTVEAGSSVDVGDVLYTVDLEPVIVAEGDVPAFRDLAPGDEGEDVSQLQALLVHVGAREAEPTGTFDSATVTQVQEWQTSAGLPVTGTVPHGSMVFVPELPRVVAWGEAPTQSGGRPGDPAGGRCQVK